MTTRELDTRLARAQDGGVGKLRNNMHRFPGQAVVILGLGRCGTSYISSFLHQNGIDLGVNLGKGGYLNPRGFFEDRRIVDFHRRLIAKTDRRGADVPLLALKLVHDPTSDEQGEACRILESLARPGLWGWKDPRTLLFIDFWLRLLPEAKLIVPIRHPLENYWSYVKRVRMLPTLSPGTFFRAYARQCQRLADVARQRSPRVYVLDAQTAYRQQQRLWKEIADYLGVQESVRPSYPVFHEKEFTHLHLTQRTCEFFGQRFPEAAAAFQELNEQAAIQFKPVPGPSRLDAVYTAIGAVLRK
jgi:hypothetical protein